MCGIGNIRPTGSVSIMIFFAIMKVDDEVVGYKWEVVEVKR
jgi:hypothetical protein